MSSLERAGSLKLRDMADVLEHLSSREVQRRPQVEMPTKPSEKQRAMFAIVTQRRGL